MKVTIEKVLLFRANANMYLQQNAKGDEHTKFKYALKKMISKTNAIQKEYDNFAEDERVDLASEDEKGILIINDKNNYVFTKENTKKLKINLRKKMSSEVTIEPHYCEAPKDLDYFYIEVFTSFVLEPEQEGTVKKK